MKVIIITDLDRVENFRKIIGPFDSSDEAEKYLGNNGFKRESATSNFWRKEGKCFAQIVETEKPE